MTRFKSKHEGVKYSCDQCDYQATQKTNNLIRHGQSKHDGVKYSCSTHKKSKHMGVKHPCDQCSYEASQKGHLSRHTKSKHEIGINSC